MKHTIMFLTGLFGLLAVARAEPVRLRLALLPVIDALPVHVSLADGAFATAGLAVEILPVASAAERDQVVQAGRADLVVADLVALALYRQAGLDMRAIRHSMRPAPGHPQFSLLAGGAPETRPATLAGLRGAVGISQGTVSEYVTTRLLEAADLPPGAVVLEAVPAIPARLALLRAGRLAAATLPEPPASVALRQGAVALADDARTSVPGACAVFVTRGAVAEAHPEALRAFLRVVGACSRRLAADPAAAVAGLRAARLLPPDLGDDFTPPPFPGETVPDRAAWDDVCAWLVATGRLKGAPPAWDEAITAAFLPAP